MVNYLLLQKKLPKYHFQCNTQLNTSFFNCNTLIEHTICKSGTLYIGYSKHLNSDFLNNSSIGFLLLDKPNFDISKAKTTLISLSDANIDIMTLIYEVQCLFQEQYGYLNDSSLFIDGLLQEKSISELVDIGSQLLGNPIMLTNSSFKVVYMSEDQDVEDKVWKDAKKLGFCSADSISYFKNDKASITLFNNKKAFIYKTGLGKHMPRILKKISTKNRVLGYLVVFEVNHKLTEHHLEMTDFLCNFLAIEMKNNISENNTEKIYESLILDLIERKNLSNLSLSDRIHSSNWIIKPILQLICIEVDTKRTLDYYFDYITNRLLRINPFAKAVRYDGHILVVLNYNNTNEYELIAEQIISFLDQYQLYSGFSRTFSSLSEIYIHYLQAKTALTLGKLLQNHCKFFYYKDFSFYHLLSCMNSEQLLGLCSPHYIELSQYDHTNSTEYCETLYQYIESANNISTAAKALQIHRNTMSYRIEKISQLSNINLLNGEELFQFYITKKIMNWINK